MNRKITKKISKVWKYYTLENETYVCNLCNTTISHKHVGNLRKHLLRKHLPGRLPSVTSVSAGRKRRITKNVNFNSFQISLKKKSFAYNSCNTAKNKNRQRTSIVWKYFVLEDKMAECKLCKQKYKSFYSSDLKKHIKRIHPTVELHKDNSTSLSHYSKDRDDLIINPVQSSFENTCLVDNSHTAPDNEPEMPTSCWATYNLKNKFMRNRIKTSPVWNFFNLENKIAECKLCKKKLSVRSLSTSDLKKHLQRKHPTVELPKDNNNSQRYKRKIRAENLNNNTSQATSANICLTDNSENVVTTEPETSTFCSTSNLNDKMTKTGRKISTVWNFFALENNMAVCNLCKHSFSYPNSSVSPNLRRHLIRQHSSALLSEDVSSCEISEEIVNNCIETPSMYDVSVINSESTINTELGISISSLELDLNYGIRKNKNKTSILWNFFTLEGETATCKLCKKGISYRFWSLSNLKKHMLRKHPFSIADIQPSLSNDLKITEITEENFDNSTETPFIEIILLDNSESTIDGEPVSSIFCSESNLDHGYQKNINTSCLELSKNVSTNDTENNLNNNYVEIPFINISLADNPEDNINTEHCSPQSFSDKEDDTCIKNKIRTSKVWRFYTLENEMATCKLCKLDYSYKSVSGLRKHLIRKHAMEELPEDIDISNNDKSKFTKRNLNNNSENSVNIETGKTTSCVALALTHRKKKTGKRTSAIWNYFTCKDNKTALCNFCKMTFSFKSSISDLKKHLTRKHANEELKKNSNISLNHESNVTDENLIDNTGQTLCINKCLINSSEKSETVERRITLSHSLLNAVVGSYNKEILRKFLDKTLTHSTRKVIDNLILDLFIFYFQPFTMLQDGVFRESMKILSPSYRIPTKKTFMNTLLSARYEKCYNKLKKALSETNISSVTLTLDCWMLENKKCFLAVICNFINTNFNLESKLLECFSCSESYTVSELSIKLESIVKGCGLENKILLCISDNAFNTKLAVKDILKWNHFECYAHAINSIANDGLELHVNITSIIKKIKSVVEYFKMNACAMKLLLDFQEQLGYLPKELLSDVPFEWNSTFYMLERFVELDVPICSALAVVDIVVPRLDSREWKIAAELVDVLRPLEEITEIISGEDVMTASSVIIITNGMENSYKEMLGNSLLQETRELVETIALSIHCHLGDLESNDTLLISTFLDPRFKTVGFSNANTAERAKTLVMNLLISEFKLVESHQRRVENIADNGQFAKKTSSAVWNRFDKQVKQEFKSTKALHSQLNIEVQCYLEEPLLNRVEDPLKWWQKNSQIYPHLKMLFLKKFAVLATSVPCEKLLSKIDKIPSDWRTRFSLDQLEELVFLNANDQQERSKLPQ